MWANLCVGRPLCVAGIPCRPYPCAWHGLSAGIMRQRATLRPCMVASRWMFEVVCVPSAIHEAGF